MKVLVVGDGALGQVFGLRLAIGGASVSYLVKSGRADWGFDGRTLYRLRRLGKPVAQQLRPHGVHSEITDGRWDMVWLCVPSTALRKPWLYQLRDAVGTATVVSIGQDLHDRAVLANIWPPEQIVQVAPAVLAYSAPLVTEVPAPGIAYWMPPGTVTTVSGSADRAFAVVAALRAGHMRARYSGRTGSGELAAALMMPVYRCSGGRRLVAVGPARRTRPTCRSQQGGGRCGDRTGWRQPPTAAAASVAGRPRPAATPSTRAV